MQEVSLIYGVSYVVIRTVGSQSHREETDSAIRDHASAENGIAWVEEGE